MRGGHLCLPFGAQQILRVSSKARAISLQAMCDLFALGRIQSDIIFRNDDYVAAEKAKAIQKLIENLAKELRLVAVPLVRITLLLLLLANLLCIILQLEVCCCMQIITLSPIDMHRFTPRLWGSTSGTARSEACSDFLILS